MGENLIFLDTAISYPDRVHYSCALRNTELFGKAENGDTLREPMATTNRIRIWPLLLGDGACLLLPWLLKPYANNIALNPTQQGFNRVFSSARDVVEWAYGILKGRWDDKFIMYWLSFWHATSCTVFVNKPEKNLMTKTFYKGLLQLRWNICSLDATMWFDILQLRLCISQQKAIFLKCLHFMSRNFCCALVG